MDALVANGVILTRDGERAFADVQAKCYGIYFSAHWCPPCRGFTPVLAEFYKEVNASGKKMEIFFVSFDQTQEQFNEYFKEMPWAAFPFGDARRDALSQKFGVQGIPKFVVLKADGSVITEDGRGAVQNEGPGAVDKWIA